MDPTLAQILTRLFELEVIAQRQAQEIEALQQAQREATVPTEP